MNSGTDTPAKQQGIDGQRTAGEERGSPRVSLNLRIAILLAIWIIVLIPLLFIRTEWFGRPLSDQQIGEYLHAEQPYLVQHALTEIGDRMARRDASVNIWYADLVRLSAHPNAAVRALDVTVMGNGPSQEEFQRSLQRLLDDPSRLVRFRAALALARHDDASGVPEIASAIQPWRVTTPNAGRITELVHLNGWVRQSTTVARIDSHEGIKDVEAPVNGRVSFVGFKVGDVVPNGAELIQIEPAPDVVTDVLAGLAKVGRGEDLQLVTSLETRSALPDRVRQQAAAAAQAIRARVGAQRETLPGKTATAHQ